MVAPVWAKQSLTGQVKPIIVHFHLPTLSWGLENCKGWRSRKCLLLLQESQSLWWSCCRCRRCRTEAVFLLKWRPGPFILASFPSSQSRHCVTAVSCSTLTSVYLLGWRSLSSGLLSVNLALQCSHHCWVRFNTTATKNTCVHSTPSNFSRQHLFYFPASTKIMTGKSSKLKTYCGPELPVPLRHKAEW